MLRRTFCLSISAQLAGQTRSWSHEADALMGRAVDEGKLAGAVARIEQDGRALLSTAKGWPNLEERTKMTVYTIFDMQPITPRHLLTHTARLAHERPAELNELTEKRDRTLADVVAMCVQGPLIAQPGARWSEHFGS